MYDFQYQRPGTLADAAEFLAGAPEAKLMSGGMSLLPVMKQRLAKWSSVIDLSGIPGLDRIEATATGLIIGARARHVVVATSAAVRASIPALSDLAEGIGDPLVRNRGTIGGSIANSDTAADYPSAVLGLDATVITNRREIAGSDFFHGLFETALERDEIIVAVRFPKPLRAAYAKFRHPASRFAIVGAFVAETQNGVRVSITGAGPCVFRVREFEQALTARFAPEAIDGVNPAYSHLNSDLHASAAYRAHLIGEMVQRAVQSCMANPRRQKGEA